tara:strand:- start:666 stop:1262 length:597 start_codon:yes stop_codon:yes gene_type:complete
MTMIVDGTGKGYQGKIDGRNQLWVRSVSVPEAEQALIDGKFYNFNTGNVTLTTANESALMYLKNNSETDLIITRLAISTNASTGGTSDRPSLSVLRNPTSGTIIDNALAPLDNCNTNFGSANVFDGQVYKGAEGYTLTGEDQGCLFIYCTNGGDRLITFDIEIPKAQSIGFMYTPSPSNTSQKLYLAVNAHYRDDTAE